MSEHDRGARPAPRTVTIGDREVTIERPSARKTSRAFAILRAVSKETGELVKRWGQIEEELADANVVTFDRVEAIANFGGPQPVTRRLEDGSQELVYDSDGKVATIPSALEMMSEEDWNAAGNVLRRRKSPDTWQVAAAVLAEASPEFEQNIYRLLALFTIPNDVVRTRRKDGTLPEYIDTVADELIDEAGADELMALAAIAGDVVDDAFRSKAREIGSSTLGKAFRLAGLDPERMKPQTPPDPTQTTIPGEEATPESRETPSSSRPTTSGDSPEPSPDGPSTTSSTPPPTSSELSAIGSSSIGG